MRRWLRHNKIFLDVLIPLIVGVASVVVAWAALSVSKEQAKIAADQAKIQRIQAMPRIRVAKDLAIDPATQYYVTESYVVHNEGGPLFDLTHRSFSLIELKRSGAKDQDNKQQHFPLNGYYAASFGGSAQTGSVLTGVGHHNNKKWGELFRFFLQASSSADGVFYEIRLQNYLRLNFTDQLGERHVEYYNIERVGGGRQIPVSEGERLESTYEKLSRSGVFDIDSTSGENLLQAFDKRS